MLGASATYKGERLAATLNQTTPTFLLHGHVHPYGAHPPDLRIGTTTVRNVVGWHLFELATGEDRHPSEVTRGA